MEILWTKLTIKHKSIAIGAYYGPQENTQRDEVKRQYGLLTNHILKLKQNNSIILTGDFNAKLEINRPNATQNRSPNGTELEEMLKTTNTLPTSIKAQSGLWTRINRKIPQKDQSLTIS